MNYGLIGAIVGSVIGIMGGIFGTYCSIKKTRGPKERAFAIKASITCWIGVILFLVLLFLLPHPYRWFLFIPYLIILSVAMMKWNRIQSQIRKEQTEA